MKPNLKWAWPGQAQHYFIAAIFPNEERESWPLTIDGESATLKFSNDCLTRTRMRMCKRGARLRMRGIPTPCANDQI